MTFSCEMKPRKVQVFIEKTHEGHILPVTDVEVVDVACGTNHSVSAVVAEVPMFLFYKPDVKWMLP